MKPGLRFGFVLESASGFPLGMLLRLVTDAGLLERLGVVVAGRLAGCGAGARVTSRACGFGAASV